MECVGQSKAGMVRGSGNLSSLMIQLYSFVIIVDDFQKVLHCACAIKILIATGRVNIRICRDITGEMWFGVG